MHPLRGPNAEDFGVRFPPLSDAYDLELRRSAHQAWRKAIPPDSKRRLHEGVYAFVGGPRQVALCRVHLTQQEPHPNTDNQKVMKPEPNAECYIS